LSIDLRQAELDARRAYDAGEDLGEIVRSLRARGCNIIDCIKIVRAISGWSLKDAKLFVHYSDAWSDRRAANDALHDRLFQLLEDDLIDVVWTEKTEYGDALYGTMEYGGLEAVVEIEGEESKWTLELWTQPPQKWFFRPRPKLVHHGIYPSKEAAFGAALRIVRKGILPGNERH
jgi:hypothetical protein